MQHFFIVIAILLSSLSLGFAQQKPNIDALLQQYPDEKAVILSQHETLEINRLGVQWQLTRRVTEEILFLDNAPLTYSQKNIFYSGFENIVDIVAYTDVPELKGKKTTYKRVPVNKIETKDVLDNNIFYSDHKQKQILFPGVQKGAITHLSYTEVSQEPRFITPYNFASHFPILEASFTVQYPEEFATITHKLLGDNTEQVKFTQKMEGTTTILNWKAHNLPPLNTASDAPNPSYYMPHIVVYINSSTNSLGETTPILGTVDNLYRWYASLVNTVNKTESSELKQLAQQISEGATTEREKAQKVYAWVQRNIRYVAFEDGLGGFVPREAADVLNKKYGDCKDMTSLQLALLQQLGINAYWTWIGTRDRPYSYAEVPAPLADNHMIATIQLDGKWMFLDGTGEYQPFGLPTSMIQEKEALVGISPEKYEIVIVPTASADSSKRSETLQLQVLPNGNLTGKATATFSGYKKISFQYDYLKAQADGNSQFFDEFLLKGNNKFAITQVEKSGLENNNQPATITYNFAIPNYCKKAGDRLYINLNLDKRYQNSKIDLEKRKIAKVSEYQYIDTYEMQLALPEGYVVEALPQTYSFNDSQFGFDFSYAQSGNIINVKQIVRINFLTLMPSKFPVWNEMIAKMNEAYNDAIVLKSIAKE